MRLFSLTLAMAFSVATGLHAATLNESDIPGGFSGDFTAPTQIPGGFDDVIGSLTTGGYDIFSLGELAPGAQTVSLTFALPAATPGGGFQNAGGYVRFRETPFQFSPEEGTSTSFNIFFDPFNVAGSVPSQTLSFDLDSSFAGSPLFFAVRLSNSSVGPLSFGATAPGNAIAPVPVPAAGGLLLAAMAGFGLLRGRRQSGVRSRQAACETS